MLPESAQRPAPAATEAPADPASRQVDGHASGSVERQGGGPLAGPVLGEAPQAVADGARRRAPRLALLDGLRFAAAMAVVAYHFTARSTLAWGELPVDRFPGIHEFSRYGYLGVHLFFIISGFVILMTAWGRDLTDFAASRAARLFPAYWAGVLLTGGLAFLVNDALSERRIRGAGPLDVREFLMNLTMLHEPFGTTHVDGVYWTLWVEMRFYLLVAVFMLVGITRQRVIAVAVLWPLVGTIALASNQDFLANLLIAHWAPFFAVGMLLYIAHREGWTPLLGGLCGAVTLIAMTKAGNDVKVILKNTGGAANPLVVELLVLACVVAVALATTTRGRHVSWRPLSRLGAMTYPTYLVHNVIGLWLISVLVGRVSDRLVLVLALAGVLTLAFLVNQFVEKPFAPRLRRAVQSGLRDAAAGSRDRREQS